jgi:membrane protein DedA with SNARE-associated domain
MPTELFSLETLEGFARTYGYWAILFGIMLENLGIPLPGESIVLVRFRVLGRIGLHDYRGHCWQ